MKIKRHQIVMAGVMKSLLIGLMFITISIGHAQSLQNWSDPVNLSNSGAATNPIMVTDTDAVVHVIWVDEFDGYKYSQSNNRVDWTTPIATTFPFLPEDNPPRFEATSDGIIHAFWIDEENNLYYANTPQANFGTSSPWRLRLLLGESVVDFDIVVSSADSLHVSYIKSDGLEDEPAGVYYRGSIGGSSSWSNPQNLFTSQYFRSLTSENAHIKLTVSDSPEMEHVYVVWDSLPQKQILLAESEDGGQTWNEAEQIKGPEEITGYQTPHSGEINVFGNTILLLWQVGESSNQCVQYSQFISNGDNWGEPIKVLDENLGCPEKTEVFSLDQNFALLILRIQGEISFIAWNGNQWSNPQIQNELLEFYNPATFDSIILGCQQLSLHENMIYIVGCDEGNSGDIWFSSRSLDSVENWYPSLSSWNPTGLITNTEQVISSLTSVAHLDSVHLFWVQSSRSQADDIVPSIQYSHWNDGRWSNPRIIISNLPGKPLHISATKDQEGRLLLVWQDDTAGNIYFSWADSRGANLSTEWIQPEIVPSVSQLNSSPEILVDASGRIVIAYSVSVNENRGLYIVQSTDLGDSWTSPVSVFDAVSAGWEKIDHPKISLGGDGRLHLLFNRYSLRNDDQSMGLYYMQSIDGGVTWSEPELVRAGLITWSDIYSYDQQTVHRFWREKNGLEVSYIGQFSSDAGITWEAPVKIIGASEETTQVSLAMDQVGGLHLAQLTYKEDMSLQDWKWDGSRWILQESKELDLRADSDRYSLTNSISSDGELVVSILFENSDLAGDKTDEIWNLHRILDITEIAQDPQFPIIPTPKPMLTTTEIPNIVPTTIEEDTVPIANLNDVPLENRKDLVGLFLVVAILVITVVIIRPRRKKNK